jgi:hypothetical protein
MTEIPAILAEGKGNLHPVRPFAQLAIADLQQIGAKLMRFQGEIAPLLHGESGGAASAESLRQATEKAIAALESYRSWLEQGLDKMPSNAAVGRANYEFFLNQVALLPFTPSSFCHQRSRARAVSFEQ